MTAATRIAIELAVGGRAVRVELATDSSAFAIVGPSGIGKTTLLRALAGVAPARGEVTIDGRRLDALPPHLRGLGWVPQEARLFPHLSVRENVAFGAEGDIAPIVEVTGIGALLERSPETLSGGERQRVAIARALARKPRALLLDEPLGALDVAARTELSTVLVERCRAEGIVRIVVAHDETDLATLAAERFVMDDRGIARSA